MNNYKILIVRDDELLLREFEVHNTDKETVSDVAESYLNLFNHDCEAIILTLV